MEKIQWKQWPTERGYGHEHPSSNTSHTESLSNVAIPAAAEATAGHETVSIVVDAVINIVELTILWRQHQRLHEQLHH